MNMYNFYKTYPFLALVGLITGIIWQKEALPLYILIFIPLVFLIISNYFKKKLKPTLLLLVICSFLLGSYQFYSQQNDFHTFYKKYGYGKPDLIGTIKEIEENNQNKNQLSKKNLNQKITLNISKIKNWKYPSWQNCNKNIFIYTDKTEKFEIEDTLKITKAYFKKPTNTSFAHYLLKEKTVATLFIPSNKLKFIFKPTYHLSRFIKKQRALILNNIKKKMSSNLFLFFKAVFLGEPTAKKNILLEKKLFKNWGLLHYTARSGLHLILFILFWSTFFSTLPIHTTKKQIFLLIITSIYTALSWPSIPFSRAFNTYILYKIGTLLKFQTNLFYILIIISYLTLIQNPILLFFLDFQLSFGLTGALAYFNLPTD